MKTRTVQIQDLRAGDRFVRRGFGLQITGSLIISKVEGSTFTCKGTYDHEFVAFPAGIEILDLPREGTHWIGKTRDGHLRDVTIREVEGADLDSIVIHAQHSGAMGTVLLTFEQWQVWRKDPEFVQVEAQLVFTNCDNCGSADHRGYACPCACHAKRDDAAQGYFEPLKTHRCTHGGGCSDQCAGENCPFYEVFTEG